tara:strand:- start:13303 stop:15420 length:2118 start_codon:yes stop_codon:yes gene_type:complete
MTSIVKILEDQVTESESSSYEVGQQRERNHRYHTLEPLGNEQKGRSQYISPDVMQAVESKKALFKTTFLSSRQTVKFTGGSGAQPFEADAKTAYANKALRRNKHAQLFRDGWHDAFVAKRQVFYVDWVDATKNTKISVNGATPQQLQQIVSQQGEVVGVDQSNLTSMQTPSPLGRVPEVRHSGEIGLEIDDSYAGITLITPERFYRDPQAAYPDDAMWCTWERDEARGDLVAEGFDEDQVMGLAVSYRFRSNEEDNARKSHDSSWSRKRQYDRVENQSTVTVYRTWTWLNLSDPQFQGALDDGDVPFEVEDAIKLYKICWAHGEILTYADGSLAIKEYDEMPFIEWTEMKISHAEFGLCTADVEAHGQKTQSTLKRLIIDNQQMRNNSRYEAVIGALKNPRDLLDGKIGGTIWSRRIGSVAPLATPELSPLTFNVIQMLKQDSEARDGFSALGKGMSTDAVKYQNADSMIERLTNAGTQRPMSAAHDWAENALVPMNQMIIRLAMRNDKSQSQLEVRGRVIPIIPSQWLDDGNDMEVSVALTPQEGKEFGQAMLMMHNIMSQDEELRGIYALNQKHALMDSVFDSLGVSDTTPFMQRPDSPQFMQAQQGKQAQMQEEKKKQDSFAELQQSLAQSQDRRAWDQFQWQKTNDMADNLRADEKLDLEKDHKEQALTLDYRKFDWQMMVDVEEVKIEKSQRRPTLVGNK